MLAVDPDIEEQLNTGRIDRRDAVLFMLAEGNFGFFAHGSGTLSWGGYDFVGAGALLSIKKAPDTLEQTKEAFEVSVATRYEVDGETVDVLSTEELIGIEALTYFRRPALIGKLYINPAGQVIDFVQERRCEIHAIVHDDDDKKGYSINGILYAAGTLRQNAEGKTRNALFQAQIDATDKCLNHASKTRTQTVYWGARKPSNKAKD